MSALLELREWLIIGETVEYLNGHLTFIQKVVIGDLGPLIEEKKLSVYFKTNHQLAWLKVDDRFSEFSSPKNYGSPENYAVSKSGYLLLNTDLMNWYPSFTALFLHALDCHPEDPSDMQTRIVISPPEDTSISFAALSSYDSIFSENYDGDTFLTRHAAHLIEDFWFKKDDLFNLIHTIKNPQPKISAQPQAEKQLATKSENSYLKLILALAEFATDGLTGKPSTDANAIEAALKSKNITCPVGNKALAGYLEKAQQASK